MAKAEWVADARVDGRDEALSLCRNDFVFRALLGRWGLGERTVAALTAALGFGVLTAWYLLGLMIDPAARGRRGPFEYYSATVGDLVLLPLLAAAALRYMRQVSQGLLLAAAAGRHRTQRLRELIAGAYNSPWGLAFVLAISASALLLEHLDELYGVDRNWTVPEWGRLTLAAAYHQVFFSLQALILAFLVVRHVTTVRLLLRLARSHSQRSALVAVAVAEQSLRVFGCVLLGWGAFVSLRVMDFFYLAPTVSASALATFPAVVVVLVVYYALLLATGVVPWVALTRRYGLGWMSASTLLTAIAFIAPVAGPAARILLPHLFWV